MISVQIKNECCHKSKTNSRSWWRPKNKNVSQHGPNHCGAHNKITPNTSTNPVTYRNHCPKPICSKVFTIMSAPKILEQPTAKKASVRKVLIPIEIYLLLSPICFYEYNVRTEVKINCKSFLLVFRLLCLVISSFFLIIFLRQCMPSNTTSCWRSTTTTFSNFTHFHSFQFKIASIQ